MCVESSKVPVSCVFPGDRSRDVPWLSWSFKFLLQVCLLQVCRFTSMSIFYNCDSSLANDIRERLWVMLPGSLYNAQTHLTSHLPYSMVPMWNIKNGFD